MGTCLARKSIMQQGVSKSLSIMSTKSRSFNNPDFSSLYFTIVFSKVLFQYIQKCKWTILSPFHTYAYTIFFNTISSALNFILFINLTHIIWSYLFKLSFTPCFFTICSVSISTWFLASWSIWFRCSVSFPINNKYWYLADLYFFKNCFRNIRWCTFSVRTVCLM